MTWICLAAALSLTITCIPRPDPLDAEPPERATLAHLEPLPDITYAPRPPLTDDESKHIHELIDSLTSIDRPDYGLSPTTYGSAFAALPELTKFQGGIIQIDHNFETKSAFAELVKIGPKAMPVLLQSLSDARPTKLSMKRDHGIATSIWVRRELSANPMNEREWNLVQALPPAPNEDLERQTTEHTVTVGDVCFAILGQITGRGYSAVRYQPTAIIVINSPTSDPEIARTVREIWTSADPSKALFDSLLLDFCTRGIHQGKDLSHWHSGSIYQTPAATRLLYYFPDLAAPVIAKRLDSLDVSSLRGRGLEEFINQCVANGVRSDELLKAVSWSPSAEVRQSVAGIMQRTTVPSIFLESARVADPSEHDRITGRILDFMSTLPADEGAPFGDGYHLLVAVAKNDADRARPVFEEFVKGSMHRRRAACHAVQQTKPSWGCEVLLPLLDDKQNADGWQHPVAPGSGRERIAIRVCDEAADAAHAIRPELDFKMQGTLEEMDAQVENIKRSLTQQPQTH